MTMQETHLQHLLVTLRTRLLVMCAAAGIALDDACRSLLDGDSGRATAVIDGDSALNALENEIDDKALSLLARSQPVARDLRFVVSALRMGGDLERIGDEAASIAERTLLLQGTRLPLAEDMGALMELVKKLYADAVASFRDNDKELALVASRGSLAATQVETRIMQALMQRTGQDFEPEAAIHALLITRSLNRIWRRATNIAEHAYFVAEGISIKHPFLSQVRDDLHATLTNAQNASTSDDTGDKENDELYTRAAERIRAGVPVSDEANAPAKGE